MLLMFLLFILKFTLCTKQKAINSKPLLKKLLRTNNSNNNNLIVEFIYLFLSINILTQL